ncbi:GAF domain-containing protein [Methylibium sp.]|jgi:GAF domain-containing protein|uniref:GAF domain-containing protein n=1 Tax=Methylibium sp. TaxID=2067992 RepID=UPI003D0A2039
MTAFRTLDNDDISVVISELLVATADACDPLLDGSVNEVLKALRERLGLDVVFVSEIVDGRRVFRFVDSNGRTPTLRPGDSNPVEESFCQRVVDGRLPGLIHDAMQLPPGTDVPPLPFRVGAHLSTPIVLSGGRTYGTLCCFSSASNDGLRDKDLATLKLCAQLVARKLETAAALGLEEPPADWSLEPMARYDSKVWALP